TVANGAVTFVPWGASGDFPVPGVIDGNGSADFTVQRGNAGAGNFWTRLSTGVVQPVVSFGLSNDTVVPGDYDGDGKTDIATVRAAGGVLTWYWRPSGGGIDQQVVFGASATDFPIQGDYDGDGRTDVAVWRNGTFWTRATVGGAIGNFGLGATGDYPIANFNTH
ncbi:MAG TPA: VCBS repeat-containing protein, partial [Pyrinomonadaceae bacterium]|nr:VCBS repeat-containing protein [Pyrinomonadaceae bacterium]